MDEMALAFDEAPSFGLAVGEVPTFDLSIGEAMQSGDYEALINKPRIEGTVLVGDRSLAQIGVGAVTPQDIDRIIYG